MQNYQLFLVVVAAISILSISPVNGKKLVPIEDQCATETQKIIIQAIFAYYEDVVLLSVVDIFDPMVLDMFQCTNGNNFNPVFSRRSYVQASFYNLDYGTLNTYPNNRGTCLKGNFTHTIEVLFWRVFRNNPRSRTLYIVEDSDYDSIRYLLMHGYYKFKFIENSILTERTEFDEATGKNHTVVVFCTFNPFVDKGILFCKNLTIQNVYSAIKEIRNFMIGRLKNLENYPLKVFMFDYPMQSKAVLDENGEVSRYEYMDGEIISIFVQHMKFTPIYIIDNDTFGIQTGPATFTGALNSTETEYADIAGNTRILMDLSTNRSVFLKTITFGRYFFIIPAAITQKEVLLSLVRTFDWYTNIMFAVCFLMFPFFLYFIMRTEEIAHYGRARSVKLSDTAMQTTGITCGVASRLSRYVSSRIFLVAILWYSIIQITLFQGTIIRNLNNNIVFGEIKTLDQLLDKDYRFALPDMLHTLFSKSDGSRIARKMKEISINYPAYSEATRKSKNKNVATMMREVSLKGYLDEHYDAVTKKNLYTVVPECAFQFYLSLIVPKNSPYQDVFNDLIQSIVEAGIIQYQLSLASINNLKIMIRRTIHGEVPKDDDKIITLNDIKSIFYLYFAMNGIAITVFMGELIAACAQRKKHKRRVRFAVQ